MFIKINFINNQEIIDLSKDLENGETPRHSIKFRRFRTNRKFM